MISRRAAVRALIQSSLGLGLAAGVFPLVGCGYDQGLPVQPLGKKKEELGRDAEMLDGIPIKGTPRKKRR